MDTVFREIGNFLYKYVSRLQSCCKTSEEIIFFGRRMVSHVSPYCTKNNNLLEN